MTRGFEKIAEKVPTCRNVTSRAQVMERSEPTSPTDVFGTRGDLAASGMVAENLSIFANSCAIDQETWKDMVLMKEIPARRR